MRHLVSQPARRALPPGVRRAGTALAAVIAHMAGRAIDGWIRCERWRLMHRTARALHALDDRTLKDIGLDRSQIDSVSRSLLDEERPPRGNGGGRQQCGGR